MSVAENLNINNVSNEFNMSWPTIARVIVKVCSVMDWIRQEAKLEPLWEPLPWLNPSTSWSHFIRMFATEFYQKRYGAFPPTEI